MRRVRDRRAARSGADLTQRLLVFSRDRDAVMEPLVVADVVRDVRNLLARTLEANIEIEVLVPADLPPVRMDRSDLEQALINVVLNARDAMPSGGHIAITASAAEHEGRPAVRLAVHDTGAGMTPEVVGRAVEPFFTTKPVGRGTGLGLSTVSAAPASRSWSPRTRPPSSR